MPVPFPNIPEPGSFGTRAIDMLEWLNDWLEHMLRRKKSEGRAPASQGVTKPVPKVETFDDALDVIRGWGAEQKKRKGGRAIDNEAEPSTNTYRQRRFDFISREEGLRTRVYDDKTGKPVVPGQSAEGFRTIGIGFNMDRPDARKVYEAATGARNFDAVKAGEEKITRAQAQKLFDHTVREAEDIVQTKFGDQDLPEHQRLSLVSLAFNNPSLIGPNLTQFVLEGNEQAAVDEILFKSNAKRVRGLASRRWREASMFAGPADSANRVPTYHNYISDFYGGIEPITIA